MPNQTFTVVLSAPRSISAALEEAVFGVGCDDAALCERSGVVYLDFDRDADTLEGAFMEALQQLSGIDGVRLSHVGPEDLVTTAEIARRAGVVREAVRLWAAGERGPGGFPVPVAGVDRQTRVWRWADVAQWLESHSLSDVGSEDAASAQLIAEVNARIVLGELSLAH